MMKVKQKPNQNIMCKLPILPKFEQIKRKANKKEVTNKMLNFN